MEVKFICEELSFFASNQSITLFDLTDDINEETRTILDSSFLETKYIYNASKVDPTTLKCDIFVFFIDELTSEIFDIIKEIRINSKELNIIVKVNKLNKMIQNLFDLKINSVLLPPFVKNEILLKILLESENSYIKESYQKLHNEMYLYNLKKDLQKASKDIKEIETQRALDSDENLDQYIENFHHDHVIDDSMWKHISDEIFYLNEIYEENINKIVLNGFDENIKDELVDIFSKYNSSLLLIPGLEDFASIFSDVSVSLKRLDLSNIDSQSMEVFDMFEYLFDDITKFFTTVLVEKKTKNLNYLTDSMKSSVLQLKIKLGLVEFEEEELELF